MVLMMSDQQMVTGIALLFSAAAQLRCSISAYHWQVMIYLVWLSSFTHLGTLTILRRYFYNKPLMRLWRLVFITILILLLIAALIPTGNLNWLPLRPQSDTGAILPFDGLKGVPALCLYRYPLIKIHLDNLHRCYSLFWFCVLAML